MLQVEGLTKSYRHRGGGVEVLRDLDLRAGAGEFVAVSGPSGCGKTTFLLIAGALLVPDSGSVRVGDASLYAMSIDERAAYRARNIGFVFQQFHLMPYLSVRENILVPGLVLPEDLRPGAEALIDRLGLRPRAAHLPSELSVGERQRTALARGLVHRPSLVLADEPTGNLDTANADIVIGCLGEYAAGGGTVLMATHSREAAARADRFVDLKAEKSD